MAGSFAAALLGWYDAHGRRGLPWQVPCPYRRWVSEIMLQQTTVRSAIPYFGAFLARFPSVEALAGAPLEDVMRHWAGLGYYARARNLHAAARRIVADYGGQWPRSVAGLAALPGIGRSTAGAIAAFAFGVRAPILDANVRRVLRRYHDEHATGAVLTRRLWAYAEEKLPPDRIEDYTQAVMDLGALVCRKVPACLDCPLKGDCRFTGDAPARVRPAKPARQATLLLARRSDRRVLLVRRPAEGIWGGLWSLPECARPEDARDCLGACGVDLLDHQLLAPVVHHFTHFALHIQPVLAQVRAGPSTPPPGSDMMWHPLDQPAPGVSAPVGRLLNRIKDLP